MYEAGCVIIPILQMKRARKNIGEDKEEILFLFVFSFKDLLIDLFI